MLHHKIHSAAALGQRGGDAHLCPPMACAANGGLLMIVGIMDRKYTAMRLKCCRYSHHWLENRNSYT